ncbi:hypothetical protein FIC87_11385 [Eggerthella lenta]|uniref:Uncharacterized protein n=1 Tax=Eggerthella lenta TaxID=84112 RepID=A0A5C5BSF5_EGGLN|nr:hypothetical protein [Eggerthella lenta]TNU89390.1 hypothetical protein FIC87_11385 [Eggerthella lenta]
MALSKHITLPSGVQVDYHRVVRIDKVVNVQNVVEVASYTFRAKREEERAWYAEEARRSSLAGRDALTDEERALLETEHAGMDVYVETGIYETPYDPGMTPEAAYAWLKGNRPEFADAADVLEDGQGEEAV